MKTLEPVRSGPALGRRLAWAAASDVGMRSSNEDSVLTAPTFGLFAVADGMGGHAAGEVASKLAVDVLARTVCERSGPADRERRRRVLAGGVEVANLYVYEDARDTPAHQGMGTTLSACLFGASWVAIAHVGDSRVYRFRGGKLEQLTTDHTVLQEYLARCTPTPEQIAAFPKNVITRALGTRGTVKVDTRMESTRPGDVLLLCTDGLTGALDDREIARVLAQHTVLGPGLTLDELMRAAAPRASDNFSAILVSVEGA